MPPAERGERVTGKRERGTGNGEREKGKRGKVITGKRYEPAGLLSRARQQATVTLEESLPIFCEFGKCIQDGPGKRGEIS